MNPSNRVIYSPVRRHNQSQTTTDARCQQQTIAKQLDQGPQEFESFESEDGSNGLEEETRTRARISQTSSSTRNNQSAERKSQRSTTPSRDEEDDEQLNRLRNAPTADSIDETKDVEEVYLWNCCGVTKQLEPAMRYVPVFSSLLALVNLLLLAFGLASLALGLWFRFDPKVYELRLNLDTQNFALAGWLMLANGLVAALLALFVGCSSRARNDSPCSMVFYALVASLLAICSLIALTLLTVYGLGDSLERFLTKQMLDQVRRRSTTTNDLTNEDVELLPTTSLLSGGAATQAAQFVDFVQVKLACCGARDFRDYQKLGAVVPATCYAIAANFIQAPGCGRALRELLDLRAGLAAGCAAASCVTQLAAVLLASLLACSIYNKRANPRPVSPSRVSLAQRSQSPRSAYLEGVARGAPVALERPISSYAARPLSRSDSIEV